MADTEVRVCEECGASIYPEHIGAQKAGYWGGKLFCVHCFGRHQHAQVTISPAEVRGPSASGVPVAPRPAQRIEPALEQAGLQLAEEPDSGPTLTQAPAPGASEPMALGGAEEISLTGTARPAIKPFTAAGGTVPSEAGQHRHKRHLSQSGKGAIRCRIFHAKLNDGALHFMQDQINDWIDQNPEVEIKHLNTNVGVVEGKSSEPHLIITVFY